MEKLLISACLLGDDVRYDGRNCFIGENVISKLKKRYELISICPEVMSGMGVPRDPVELRDHCIVKADGEDITALFNPVKNHLSNLILKHSLKKALLKEKSPSCGVETIYSGNFDGKLVSGMGIIARYLYEEGLSVYSENQVMKLL